MNEAKDLTLIEARLRPDEKVLFFAEWNRMASMKNSIFVMLFFGGGAFLFYSDYYAYDSMRVACGDLAYYKCGKFYSIAWWFVPMSGAMAAVGLYAFLAGLFGWHRQIYAITDQRALCARLGFPRGFDAFDLSDTTYAQISGGVELRKGMLMMIWTLGRIEAQKASTCLNGLIGDPKS